MIVHAMILLCSLLEDKFDSFDVSTNKWRRSVASSDHDVAVLCKTPEIALTGVPKLLTTQQKGSLGTERVSMAARS